MTTPSVTSPQSDSASEQRMSVDIWSDIACPWCFIGKRRFESALEQSGLTDSIDVTYHSYQLDPTLPDHYHGTEEQYLGEMKGLEPTRVRQMLQHVTQQAAGEGLTYDFDNLKVANSFNAHRLLHLAKAHGVGSQLKELLLSAHFERGLDTNDAAVLADLAVEAGLDRATAEATIKDENACRQDVLQDFAQARAYGIQGVPFFVIDNKYGVSGAQPSEAFEQALTQAFTEKHPAPLTMMSNVKPGEDGAVCGPEGCN